MEEASPVRARLAIILVSLAVLSLLRTAENYPGPQGGKRNLLLSPLKERSVSRTSTYPRDLTAARLTRTRGLRNVGEVTLWGGGGAGSKPENASRGDDRLNTSDSNNLPPPLCVLKVVQGSLIAHQVLVARGIFGLEDAVHVTYTKSSFSRDFERGDGSGAIVLSHATNGSVITKNAMEAIAYMQKNLSHAAYVNVDLYHENDEAMKQRCEKLGAWLESDFSEAMINCARARVRRHPSTYKQFLDSVFGALERIEHLLTYQPWISGRNVTLADVQLFPMLVRLDHIFHALGVNRNYAMHMPSTNSYMRTIYQIQGVAEAMPMQQIRDYYFNSQMLNPGGFHSQGPEFDLDTAMPRRDDIGIAGFYKKVYPVAEEPGLSLQVQQVSACGDCLFQSIAIGLAFARDLRHLDMYDSSLKGQSLRLRKLAVKTLRVDTDLFLTDEEYISTRDMVECAAEQFNCTGDGYLTDMLRHTTWGGGPEIVALANALRRPIHVYEPVCSQDNKTLSFESCGKFGSPMFDDKRAIYILAADDRFPECKPNEVRRHGSGGNHFLALIPNWSNMTDTNVYATNDDDYSGRRRRSKLHYFSAGGIHPPTTSGSSSSSSSNSASHSSSAAAATRHRTRHNDDIAQPTNYHEQL